MVGGKESVFTSVFRIDPYASDNQDGGPEGSPLQIHPLASRMPAESKCTTLHAFVTKSTTRVEPLC